jgi:transcriptional regulator with XRE-family HTH domain
VILPASYYPDGRKPADPALEWYGASVRRRRESSGLSQAGLANSVGVSQSTISRIENAQMPHASMTTVARIEHSLYRFARQRWT